MKKYSKLLAVLVLLSGCTLLNQKKAVKINDALVRANIRINKQEEKFGKLMQQLAGSAEFSALKPERLKLAEMVNAEIDTISKMEDVGGSEEIRKCELEYLQMQKKMVEEKLSVWETFNSNTPLTEVQAAAEAVRADAKKEEVFNKKFSVLQQEFARKNHIELDPNKKVE